MALVSVDISGTSSARPETLYALAKDSATYPIWSRIGSFELVKPGEGEVNGVGQVRIFRTGPLSLLEEIVALTPDRHVGYVVHKGLPFRGYRAGVDLEPLAAGGTAIRWRCAFHPSVPGTGFLCRAFMRSVLGDMVPALARAGEALERATGATGVAALAALDTLRAK
jgi:hypothetical protein